MVAKAKSGRAFWLVFAGAAGLGLASIGCAGSGDETSHQLAKMQEQVAALRTETSALSERLEALESSPVATQQAAPPPEPAEDPRPPLRVVRLGPNDAPAEDSTYDGVAPTASAPEKRVQIRSTANGLVQEDVTGDEASPAAKSMAASVPNKKKTDAPKSAPKPAPTDAKKH